MDTDRQNGHGVMGLTWLAAGALALGALLATMLEPVAPMQLTAMTTAIAPTPAAAEANAAANLIYGRVTTGDAVFEGRLRWGGDQEALWSNYFNGAKSRNPWSVYAPYERRTFKVFGLEIAGWSSQIDVGRPFMARFGDIARVDRYSRREWRITLKSGAVAHIAWGGADDMNDGVRVWDGTRGVVNLAESPIRTIEFLAAPARGDSLLPLYGTVRTRHGDFTGLVQWNRTECLVSDALDGRTADGALSVRFDTIRSIARHSPDSSLVTLVDGKSLVLSGSREVGGHEYGGIYVDDQRYGRVLVSWDVFERVDFNEGGNGRAYGDYPPGRPLQGTVTTRDGRRLTGRLVYDLDESHTTETLDAPLQGIDYTIPFSLIASITVPGIEERGVKRARVILRSGEELRLERGGDLGAWNAGILVFVEGDQQPAYVSWADVKEIEFDGAGAM